MKDQYHIKECRLALSSIGRSKSCRRFFSRSCTSIMDEMSSPVSTSLTPSQTKRNSPFAPSLKEQPQPRDSPSVFEKRQHYAKKEVEVEPENQNRQD